MLVDHMNWYFVLSNEDTADNFGALLVLSLISAPDVTVANHCSRRPNFQVYNHGEWFLYFRPVCMTVWM